MYYLQLIYLLGFCGCFCWAKDEHVLFNTTKHIYNVGDTVTLTCYVRSNWLTVLFGRKHSDLGYCSTIMNRCYPEPDIRDKYGNYELKLEKSRSMLVIKNVTLDDAGADFTCQWTSYTDTTSFAVTDEHVQFNTTKHIYNVGDTVTLTCYVRSNWLTVLFGRKHSDLGYCSTIMNRCYPEPDIRDKYGNYELKLEKSRSMLVIKNVTLDDDGADFTCQWTSYTDTTSFAVTDIPVAVTTPSMPVESISDCGVVLVIVQVSLFLTVLHVVLLIVGIAIVGQSIFCRPKVEGCTCIDILGRIWQYRVKDPIQTHIVRTGDTGQELQTNTYTFRDDKRECFHVSVPKSSGMYRVVHFTDSDEVEVVPSNWLEKTGCALWPPFKSSSKVTTAVRNREEPGHSWQAYPIKEIYGCDDYMKARAKLKTAAYEFDLMTDADSCDKRKNRPNPRFTQHESDSDECDQPKTTKKPRGPHSIKLGRMSSPPKVHLPTIGTYSQIHSPVSAKTLGNQTQGSAVDTNSKKQQQADTAKPVSVLQVLDVRIFTILEEIKSENREIRQELKAIRSRLTKSGQYVDCDCPEEITLPMNDDNDIKDMELKLRNK